VGETGIAYNLEGTVEGTGDSGRHSGWRRACTLEAVGICGGGRRVASATGHAQLASVVSRRGPWRRGHPSDGSSTFHGICMYTRRGMLLWPWHIWPWREDRVVCIWFYISLRYAYGQRGMAPRVSGAAWRGVAWRGCRCGHAPSGLLRGPGRPAMRCGMAIDRRLAWLCRCVAACVSLMESLVESHGVSHGGGVRALVLLVARPVRMDVVGRKSVVADGMHVPCMPPPPIALELEHAHARAKAWNLAWKCGEAGDEPWRERRRESRR